LIDTQAFNIVHLAQDGNNQLDSTCVKRRSLWSLVQEQRSLVT